MLIRPTEILTGANVISMAIASYTDYTKQNTLAFDASFCT